MEWRSANGDYDRVPALVADLIRSNIDVMVHDSTIEVLDERFGPNGVNIAARTKDEAMKICNRIWPREPPGGG